MIGFGFGLDVDRINSPRDLDGCNRQSMEMVLEFGWLLRTAPLLDRVKMVLGGFSWLLQTDSFGSNEWVPGIGLRVE